MRAPTTLVCCAVTAIVLAAYLPFFKGLGSVSGTSPYAGHVVFVPIFAAVLGWAERGRVRPVVGRATPLGAALTVFALALVGVGYVTADLRLQALSLIVATAGLALSFYGFEGLRASSFVLAFLLLTIPPPTEFVSAFAPALQQFVAAFSAVVLESLQIPVEQHGILLRLPGMTLEVAEECAGLRFLLILFVFASAFARLVVPTVTGQAVVVAVSIPVAILANAVRVAVTSVGAYAIGPEAVTGPLHYYIGKGLWALALLVMIGLGALVRARTLSGVSQNSSAATTLVPSAP